MWQETICSGDGLRGEGVGDDNELPLLLLVPHEASAKQCVNLFLFDLILFIF